MVPALTVSEEYRIQWRRAKTDLSKLARLRWIEKLSVAHIAKILDRAPETVQMYLCSMRKPGGLKITDLSPSELKIVNDSKNKVFQGK